MNKADDLRSLSDKIDLLLMKIDNMSDIIQKMNDHIDFVESFTSLVAKRPGQGARESVKLRIDDLV